MCGIAGLVCLGGSCEPEDHRRTVTRMCALQVHRGPDDTGVEVLGHACLGTNRLSIIDLSAAGHMPMATEDGRWWITYNGEVYNFQPLREELARLGHRFRSGNDTETVLHAFARWGLAALERFVGMFAFAVLDTRTGVLTLARDRFGKKPLYWTVRDGHLLFASEIKVLVQEAPECRVNRQRLAEWALYRTTDVGSPATLVDGVFSLPAGHLMQVVGGRPEPPRPYYAPAARVDVDVWRRLGDARPGAVLDEIEAALMTAVRDRLVSDVRLGTLCSGGVDSSLVTALCARDMPGVAAFNVSLAGYEPLDESRYAQAVADALGIELLVCPLTPETYRESLVRAIYHSDVPLTHPNSVAFMLVAEFARRHGVTILLSGEGADELFGGYPHRYRRYGQFLRAQPFLAHLPARARRALAFAGSAATSEPFTRLSYEGLVSHALGFVDGFARHGIHQECLDAYAFVPDATDRAVMAEMLGDLSIFLPALLRRLDRMSMAVSVECRAPFLDHRLVDLAINLPLGYRLHGPTDKWALKAIAARHLPASIVYRKKVGFPLPIAEYLAPLARRDFFRDGFCEAELGMDRRGLHATIDAWRENVQGFFSLLALEAWGRIFVRRERAAEVSDRLLAAPPARRAPDPAPAPVAPAPGDADAPPRGARRSRLARGAVIGLLLALCAGLVVDSVRNDAATTGELGYLLSGYALLRGVELRGPALGPGGGLDEQPPLVKTVAALPLLLLPLRLPEGSAAGPSAAEVFYEASADPDRALFWARMPMLVLLLLLALLVERWARRLYGPAAGLLALFLVAFNTTLLETGRFVMLDIGIAFFYALALYLFLRALRRPWLPNTLVAGVAFGLAQLASFSALALVPTFVAIAALAAGRAPARAWRAVGVGAIPRTAVVVWLIGGVLVAGAYGVVVWAATSPESQAALNRQLLGDPRASETAAVVAELTDAWRPAGYYALGLAMVYRRVVGQPGHGAGLLAGRPRGLDGLVAFLLRTQLPLIVLLSLAALALVDPHAGFEGRAVLVAAVVYAALAFVARLDLRGDHLLPVYPLLICWASQAVHWARTPEGWRPGRVVVATALAGWYVLSAAGVHPHYEAYVNELGSGPARAWASALDSRVDLGQDIKRLGLYARQAGIEPLTVLCATGADVWPCPEVRHHVPQATAWDPTLVAAVHAPRSGFVAVSRHMGALTDLALPQRRPEAADEWREFRTQLSRLTPVHTVGRSVDVYRLGVAPGGGATR
jgi:asparagine synthase (glutamine-hydrolysing)